MEPPPRGLRRRCRARRRLQRLAYRRPRRGHRRGEPPAGAVHRPPPPRAARPEGRRRRRAGPGRLQLVNSLDRATFEGTRVTYARPGRIPGSSNVFVGELLSPDGGARDAEELRPAFAAAGALEEDTKVVTYCGSGIAATYLAFNLARLGRDDVAVYDGSMTEWAADESLPLEVGAPKRG
nr:rhodanese-like domain-containing protein [Georgenia sp. SYP-B2076]